MKIMTAALIAILPLRLALAGGSAGNIDVGGSGDWMLTVRTEGGVVSIKTGLSREECVRALWQNLAPYAAGDPSQVRHTYQMPDPSCEKEGRFTVGHLYGTRCGYRKDGRKEDLFGMTGMSYSTSNSTISDSSCLDVHTGAAARDLRLDGAVAAP